MKEINLTINQSFTIDADTIEEAMRILKKQLTQAINVAWRKANTANQKIHNTVNKTLHQTNNILSPVQTYGVTPTPKKIPEVNIDLPLFTIPDYTPASDHTDTPEERAQTYLHALSDNRHISFPGDQYNSEIGGNTLSSLTPEERQQHEEIREQRMADDGYFPDGQKTFLKYLSESKTMEGLQNNIVLPSVELANVLDGASFISELLENSVAKEVVTSEIVVEPAEKVHYTKSSLSHGRKMHTEYKSELADQMNTIKEYRLPSGKRIDFLDIPNKTIYELKPFNPKSIKMGQNQLNIYKKELQSIPRFQGIEWKIILDTY